nr:MAG TPA: hypothetical protein [Caudoviricetes sp.]
MGIKPNSLGNRTTLAPYNSNMLYRNYGISLYNKVYFSLLPNFFL